MAKTKTPSKSEKEKMFRKDVAIMKAQNELMEYAAESLIEHHNRVSDDDTPPDTLAIIEAAQRENYEAGRSLLNLSPEEISKAEYAEASGEYKAKYEEHLKKRHMTDEEVRRKDVSALIETSEDVEYGDEIDRARLEREYGGDGSLLVEDDGVSQSDIDDAMRYNFDESVLDSDDVPKSAITDDGITAEPLANSMTGDGYDFGAIAANSDFDIIPLPSKGECYRHKKDRIAVSFLNAEDENVITSPNLYKDGKVMDVLLARKIIDKDVNPKELCNGDRDAIILWLRATGYGADFPIKVRDPKGGDDIETVVRLDKMNFRPFDLKGDENGLFEYTTKGGDVIKFRFPTNADNTIVRKEITRQTALRNKESLLSQVEDLKNAVTDDRKTPKAEKEKLYIRLIEIEKWVKKLHEDDGDAYSSQVTDTMFRAIHSVNGNSDRKYVSEYIRKMRAREALDFRTYMKKHEPGMDFRITVKRPESQGGGSFDTFLNIDDFIFLSVS